MSFKKVVLRKDLSSSTCMDAGLFIISVSMQLRIFAGPFLFLSFKSLEIMLSKHYKATYYSPLLSENDGKYNIDVIFSIFTCQNKQEFSISPLKNYRRYGIMQSLAFFPIQRFFLYCSSAFTYLLLV